MKIPKEMKELLLSELEYVNSMIKAETDPKRKTYFLSAAHGAVERIMRYTKEGDLYIVHFTLNICHGSIGSLLQRISGGDTAILPPDNLWDQVIENLDGLIHCIDNEESCYPILEKIALLTYSLTGPGYYSMKYQESQST